eukprot:9477936-Karenia_brevis.AAC.1
MAQAAPTLPTLVLRGGSWICFNAGAVVHQRGWSAHLKDFNFAPAALEGFQFCNMLTDAPH